MQSGLSSRREETESDSAATYPPARAKQTELLDQVSAVIQRKEYSIGADLKLNLLPLTEMFRAIALPVRVLRMERFLQQLTPHNSGEDYRQFALHRSSVAAARARRQFLCFASTRALRLQNHDQDHADCDPETLRGHEM